MKSVEKISKNIKGGARKGAGRKPGSPNKKTSEVVRKAEESGIMPLEFMLNIMRSGTPNAEMTPQECIDFAALRFEAAKAAAPYLHPKLSSIEVNANISAHESSLDDLA